MKMTGYLHALAALHPYPIAQKVGVSPRASLDTWRIVTILTELSWIPTAKSEDSKNILHNFLPYILDEKYTDVCS